MHEKQYREYKSGLAKEQFNKDLLERMEKAAKGGQQVTFISAADKRAILHPNSEPVEAPQAGTVLWELDYNEDSHAPAFGKLFRQGDLVCYLQTQHGIEPLTASFDSRLVAIDKQQGEKVVKGDAICWLEKAEIPAEPKATVKPKESKADKKPAAAKKSAWKDSMNVIKAEKK
jgi:pyruvate carboxylase subunit B